MPVRRTTARASFISGPTISGFGSPAITNCALPLSRTSTASASIGCGRRTIFFFVIVPSSQITAAADIQGNARDITRFVRSKKYDPRADLLHRAEASQRNLAKDSLLLFLALLVPEALYPLAGHGDRRRDGIHPYPARTKIIGQLPCEAFDPGFGRRVLDASERSPPVPGQSGHVHDGALALLYHRRDHLLAAQKRALQIDIHHKVPVPLLDLGKPVRGVQGAAGVVHQKIDVSPEVERLF